jgi:sugar phosphate isomerase/epimerase
MIRIGCCFSLDTVSQSKTGSDVFPLFAKAGFDYLELPLAQVMELSGGDFRDLRNKIGAGGIPVEACNNFLPGSLRLTGEEAKPGEALEYVRAAVDRAAALGVKIIVLGSSGARRIPPGFPYERARKQFAEFLVKVQDILVSPDLTVVLEPLNTKECNFLNSVAEGLALVRELSLKNIKLLADYYHMRMENEDQTVIREAGPFLRHVHIAAKAGRLFPQPGDGEDYGQFFTLLKAADYQGRLSLEGSSKDPVADGEGSLKLLRSLTAQ